MFFLRTKALSLILLGFSMWMVPTTVVAANLIYENESLVCGSVLSFESDTRSKVCNGVRIGEDLFLTNAHCAQRGDAEVKGCNVDADVLDVSSVFIDSLWDRATPNNDLAVIKVSDVNLDSFFPKTSIERVSMGCNYFMVTVLDGDNLVVPVCVNQIEEGFFGFEVADPENFKVEECSGFSGSPVYNEDFSGLLGVVSGANQFEDCGENFYGVDLKNQSQFLNEAWVNLTNSTGQKCGESCTESSCSFGLTCVQGRCSTDKIELKCENLNNEYCSSSLGIGCEAGNICYEGACRYIDDVVRVNSFNSKWLGNVFMFFINYYTGWVFIVICLVLFLVNLFRNGGKK